MALDDLPDDAFRDLYNADIRDRLRRRFTAGLARDIWLPDIDDA